MTQGRDDASLRAAARVGQILRGKWRLDRLLGIGGTACVYAATHRNGQRGAVKLLRPEHAGDEEARQRFLREGYVANRVAHPGAVAVLDDDIAEDGSPFLVMELLDGDTLEQRASKRPGHRLTPAEVAFVADRLLDVLAAAHDKGIVHRDIKPENVFLTRAGEVRILDFGIARIHEAQHGPGRLTEVGSVMGTPAFMPPEQALGHTATIDARTDIWALGAVLFYALTGRVIHEADTVNKVLLSAMTRPAPQLASILQGLPSPFCEVIDRALAFQQKDRWQDARSMQRALRAVIPSLPPGMPGLEAAGATALSSTAPALAHDATAAGGRGSRTVALATAFVLLLGAIGATAIIMTRRKAPPVEPAAAAAPPAPPPPTAEPAPAPAASEETVIELPETADTSAPASPAVKSAPQGGSRPTYLGNKKKKKSDSDLNMNQW
ncbi:serine/threonine-protein kinase [Polyangium aurulentum]|uniref:serine/threonine-protein kinase n=1 Tax=Polyangium aurulentum TaxID=2567896 RepID=UPI0010AE5B48|nr:serine/threonine-protein kinase [Polyangium aurulentum]UQA58466.1 serine/threonine protein kinase [Polyangium aurulentum]